MPILHITGPHIVMLATHTNTTPNMILLLLANLLSQAGAFNHPDGRVLLPANYSRYYCPVKDMSTIMDISVGLVITEIIDIDFEQSALSLNVEFIVKWQDELIDIEEGIGGLVEVRNISEIWTPDFYIYRLKKFEVQKISQSSTHLTLQKNGSVIDVHYMFEALVVIICDAKFADFPFHKHDCYLKLGSFTKTNKNVKFHENRDYDSSALVELKSFDYRIETSYLTGSDTVMEGIKDPAVLYSVVGIKLELFSKWQKYITLYYIPTILIVVTSWIFFLLPSTSYPARTSLLVTVFLLLISIFSSVVNETPNTNDGGE